MAGRSPNCANEIIRIETRNRRILQVRVGSNDVDTICTHHFAAFLKCYGHYRRNDEVKCCNPFRKHPHVVGVQEATLLIGNLRLIP